MDDIDLAVDNDQPFRVMTIIILFYFILLFYYYCSSSYMFYINLLSPLQVADLVGTHRLLRPVLYQLPDPVGPHQFTQPVIAGSLT